MAVAISIFILDVTSVMLIVFGFLMAVSGLCITKPEIVERVTFGVFTYGICVNLHLGTTAVVTLVTVIFHGVAGFYLWLLRMGRDWPWLWIIGLVLAAWFIYLYYV